MANPVLYYAIWAPLLFFGILFYIATIIVLIRKRTDAILGRSFFQIHIVLGVVEIWTSLTMHLNMVLPKFGILVDEFYLPYITGFWAQLFYYFSCITGDIQYSVISLVALNRIVVLVGWSKFSLAHFNKIVGWALTGCIVVPAMMHLPTFISTSRYVDFRINTTDISTLTAIAALNTDNVLIGKLVIALMAAIKMSNAMFNLIVIFIVLWIACKRKNEKNLKKNKIHEIQLSIAVICIALLNGISSVILLGNFYFWPAYRNILVEFVYIIEDSSRMLTPILLFIFSTPLRKAFRQIYWSKITAHNNVLRHSQHISIISRPHPNQVHTY